MRKHFLLLFLMALLPLAGWAQATKLSEQVVVVTLNRTQLDYTGNATAPVITALTVNGEDKLDKLGTDLVVTYYDADDHVVAPANLRNAGDYYLTLKGDGDPYDADDESDPVNFTINKGTLHITFAEAGTEKVYGAADPIALEYTWDNPSELKGTDDVNNVILSFTGLNEFTTEGVGTYTFTHVAVTTPNYTVTATGTAKLVITPAPLTIVYDSHKPFVKSYGEANPALDANKIVITGWTGNEIVGTDEEKADKQAAAVTGTLAYTQATTDANYNTAGDALLSGKADYACTFSGLTSTNYDVAAAMEAIDNVMHIKQVALAATPAAPLPANNYFTYVKPDGTFTYNGADQAPEYAITYKDAQGNNHELDDDQVELSYTYSATEAGSYGAAADNTKAGYYKLTVTAKATGNYSGNVADVANCNYSIGKKNLWIYVASDEKVYDTNGFDLTALGNDDFEFNGLADVDNNATFIGAITNLSAKWWNANAATPAYEDATPAAVSTTGYAITPIIGAGSNLNNNYNPTALSTGKYKITARHLTAKAVDKTITFGDAEPAWASTDAFIALTGYDADGDDVEDANTGVAGDDVAEIAAEKAIILGALTVALNGTYTTVDTYTDAIEITDDESATNYVIHTVPGTYKINGATFTMIAENKTITYGDPTPTFTCLTNGDDPQAEVEYLFHVGTEWVDEAPTEAGTYEIRIVEKNAYLPANYELPISYVPGTFKINKKALTITPQTVVLNIGATEAVLNEYGTVAYTGLEEGDDIAYTLKFNTTVGDATQKVEVTADALSSAVGNYTKGVTVTALANVDGKDNKNYIINMEADGVTPAPQYGQITVIAADALILAQNDVNLPAKIDAKNNVANTVVSFGARTMKEKEWYTVVLPFAVTPAELVAQLGYVVVNRMSRESTANHIKFVLEMDNIPAGEPFLIKPAQAKNWNAATFTKTIKSALANVSVVGAGDFIGVYTNTTIKNGYDLAGDEDATCKYRWLSDTDYAATTVANDWRNPNTKACTIKPLEAYLKIPAGSNARITVEDFENGVTSIKSLSGEEINDLKIVNGWYTLNGVKLQGTPTEKGIYINNGKKVVIK